MGLTQVGLAELLNVSYRTVHKWEGGERTPRGVVVVALQLLLERFRNEQHRPR
jgi:DNA-binding transcriptional regulator YiaG